MEIPQRLSPSVWARESAGQWLRSAGRGLLLTLSVLAALLPGRDAAAACTYTGVGNNSAGQTNVPALDNVLLLTSGSAATAALSKFGDITVWGNDFNGLVSQKPTGSGYKDVALSGTHGLAVTSAGGVVCWSNAVPSPCNGMPAGISTAVSVAAGEGHSYVVLADGTVQAWGSSAFDAPTLANGASNIARVVANGQLAAGLTKDGYVLTWATGFDTPPTLGKARTIAVSNVAFYAVTSAGNVIQWGLTTSEVMPTDLMDIIDINAASGTVVAVDAFGAARAWGDSSILLGDLSSISNVSMFGVGPGFLIREDCGGFCGVSGSLGCCDGGTIKYCVDGTPNFFECTQTKCGWMTTVDAFDCTSNVQPPPNVKVRSWCTPDYACEPNCTDKACGDDGCGNACGTCGVEQVCNTNTFQCESGGAPDVSSGDSGVVDSGVVDVITPDVVCQPDCNGRICGDDGCGGSCGVCDNGQTCDVTGQCVATGNCSADNVDCRACVCAADPFCCTDWDAYCAQQCVGCTACSGSCTPQCDGKVCGDDGCGGSCGNCGQDQTCNAGQCVSTCTPQCSGKVCGDDGCGGSCGTCSGTDTCSGAGQCIGACTISALGSPSTDGTAIPAGLGDVVLLTHGSSAMAALKKDGSIVVWGNDFNKLVSKAPKGTGYRDVALSNTHGLAVTSDGKVICWGSGGGSACSVPSSLSNVVSVAAGAGSSYAVRATGEVVAWGTSNFDGPILANGAKNIRRVVATAFMAAGITKDGYVVTWVKNQSTPPSLGKVRSIAASQSSIWAVRTDGKVQRWGPSTTDNVPADIANVVDIGAGDSLIVALRSDGTLRAWGLSTSLLGSLTGVTGVHQIGVGPNYAIIQRCPGSCGAIGPAGCCDGTTRKACVDGAVAASTCGAGCGWDATSSAYQCDANSPSILNPRLRNWCSVNSTCTPNCIGKTCGDDGCGGTCGTCSSGQTCGPNGQCDCQPSCTGKKCGSDGCGGSCGLCPSGTACDAGSAQCKCIPQCDGKTCGPDGCGGTCGTCPNSQSCGPAGTCLAVCVPNCDGKTCGSDGCGGSCGTCGASTGPGVYFCHTASGTCRNVSCPDIPKDGCCSGEFAFYCATGGKAKMVNCGAQGEYCGWQANSGNTTIEASSYVCTSTPKSVDPKGAPRTCPGSSTCVANCNGKTCGSDGCGGSCGTCGSGTVCEFLTGQCKTSACKDLPTGGCCDGNSYFKCDQATGKVTQQFCNSGTGTKAEVCGWNGSALGCVAAINAKTTPMTVVSTCPPSVCVPKCGGKTCGPDGCGGTCGTCTNGATCGADGICKAACVPKCDKEPVYTYGGYKYYCGYDDGCGGTCGCKAGTFCDTYGSFGSPGYCSDANGGVDECKPLGITKQGCCLGKGQRKYCWNGKVVTENCNIGPCTWFTNAKQYACSYDELDTQVSDPNGKAPLACPGTVTCTPKCDGRVCGDDGCGGSCGSCASGEKCDTINGKCMTKCKDDVPYEGCCDGNTLKTCGKKVYYHSDTPQTTVCAAGTCGWNAGTSSYGCNTSGGSDPSGKLVRACKCVPQCSGRSCGPDGCGGSCGSCASGQTCKIQDASWQNGYTAALCCTPQCSGKICGPDGCGGSCGSCTAGNECDEGKCVPLPPKPDCTNTKWQGSCNGNVLQFCSGGTTIVTQDCGATGQNWCGWNPALQAYSCGTTGQADPAKVWPKAAPGTKVQCVPDCTDKECGPDGCGGNCGFCDGDGAICRNNKCQWVSASEDFTWLICKNQPGTILSPKTQKCVVSNKGTCAGFCGQKDYAWTCQCDANCATRGDCCQDYSGYCGGSSASASTTSTTLLGTSSCGNKTCDDKLGETCATCSADCGACLSSQNTASPPWVSPLPERLVMPGTLAQHAVTSGNGLDSLVPAESPVPREGLVAYAPGPASLYGRPSARLIPGQIQAGGTSSSVAGAQGNAWRFGTTTAPSWGLQRIQFHDDVPGRPGSTPTNPGGATVAMWVRVPTTAPDALNGLASVRLLDNGAASGTAAQCQAARPGDLNLELKCPVKYPNVKPQINSVYAWYGVPASSMTPSNDACATFAAAKPGVCSDVGIQAAAETACLGKDTCVLTAPAAPACASGLALKPQLYARFTCSWGSEQMANVLAVEPAADGSRLRYGRGVQSVTSRESIKDGKWHHVAVTWRSFSTGIGVGETALYIDGELQSSNTDVIGGRMQELMLGGARVYGSTGSTISGEWAGGVADLDEVFVYQRALSDTEVRSLVNKREYGILRVWPALSADAALASGWGATATSNLQTAAVTANRVVRKGNQEEALAAPWKAVSVQSGSFAPAAADADLGPLSTWTVAGWVRPQALSSANNELFRLVRGTTNELIVQRGAECGGYGVTATLSNGTKMVSQTCEHGMAPGRWHFVSIVQWKGAWAIYVDGAKMNLGSGTLPSLLSGTGALSLQVPAGVDLGWVMLAGRSLTLDELASYRNPGPDIWLDNGRYQANGSTQLRDYADFYNQTSTGEDRPLYRNKLGDSLPTTAVQNTALLSLSTSSNNDLFEMLFPARGRLAGLNKELIRPFGVSARIRVPWGNNNFEILEFVNDYWDSKTQWDNRLQAELICNFTQFNSTLSCSVKVTIRENDYFTYTYTSEARSVKSNLVPTEVDVAVTWDGKAVRAAIGGKSVDFNSGIVASTSTSATEPKSAILPMTRSGPVGVLGMTTPAKRPVGNHFRVPPGSYDWGTTNYTYYKFYGRSLSNTELVQLVEGNCTALNCGGSNRLCVEGSDNGAGAICGECKAGSFESGGSPGTSCFERRGWGEFCRGNVECASNQCYSNFCSSPATTPACVAACREKGKACEVFAAGSSWAFTQCSQDCLPFFTRENPLYSSAEDNCVWTPTAESGEVCTADDECKSGGCSGVQDFVYNISVDRNPACKSDGTCPGWYNTSDGNKPFKCNAKYGMLPGDADVCMWNPQGNTGIKAVKRCDATSTQACGEIHRQSVVTTKTGPLGSALYKCGECESGTYKGSDNVTRPLWVKRWRFLSPEACSLMHANLVRAWVGGRYKDVPSLLWEEPSAATLGQFILEKPRGSTITPKEFASMIEMGVGPELVDYVLDDDTRAKWNTLYGPFWLASCAKDTADKVSPFTDPNANYMICAPNQFPDGTPCPPPGIDAKLADSFCQSGFCARDTGVCEEGYGRLEQTDAASRRDDKKSDNPVLGGMDFTQTNTTTLEFKKIKDAAKKTADPQRRTYSLSAGTANTLTFFGATLDVMAIRNTMSGVLDGSKEATFTPSVVLFGISQPQSGGPPLKCPGATWENGKLKQPDSKSICDLPTPGKHGVQLPSLKICSPAPGGCEDDEANSPFNTVQKGSGPLCVKRFVFVGPVPLTIEASVVIEACLGYGAGVDPESYEGSFEIRPEVGVSVEVAGGVGGDIWIAEVFAGVKAALTIVNLAFPIKWAMAVTQLNDDQDNPVTNMWQLEYARTVSAELNILKLALSVFAEVGVAIFKAEWEYVIFEYEGLTFSWELNKASLFNKKIDLQHKTANQ